jgi:hypothetical protein
VFAVTAPFALLALVPPLVRRGVAAGLRRDRVLRRVDPRGLLAGLTGPRTALALAGVLLLATPLLLPRRG